MGMVIGIDVGISTTKIVGISDGRVVSPMRVKATDPVTSLYGAFGKYLYDNKIQLADVEHVMLTGVGAAYISKPVYGLPTDKAGEFIADGLGARHESGRDRIIVVSMGTGTSLVLCDGERIEHIGGIGIGGGTLQGLSRLLLKTDDIRTVSEMAVMGNISNINLRIGDSLCHRSTRRHCSGAYLDGVAVGRSVGRARFNRQRHTRIRDDRQSHVVASVPHGVPAYREALRRQAHHTGEFGVLYGHRRCSLLFRRAVQDRGFIIQYVWDVCAFKAYTS